MDSLRYLTVDEVIAIHDRLLEKCGHPDSPLRDRNVLESALYRCRSFAQYEGADIARQAALLAVGISQSQAFLDGNKRTALGALSVFLMSNGQFLQAYPLEQAHWLEQAANPSEPRDSIENRFAEWIRERLIKPSNLDV